MVSGEEKTARRKFERWSVLQNAGFGKSLGLAFSSLSDEEVLVDVGDDTSAGDGGLDEEVEFHQRSSLRKGMSSAAGARAFLDTSAMATMVKTKGSIRNTS